MSISYFHLEGYSGSPIEAKYYDYSNIDQMHNMVYLFSNGEKIPVLYPSALSLQQKNNNLELAREHGLIGVAWDFQGRTYEIKIPIIDKSNIQNSKSSIILAVPSEDFRYWLITTTDHSVYDFPNNAIVVNPLGNVIKRLACPADENYPLIKIDGVTWTGEVSKLNIFFSLLRPRNNGHSFTEKRYLFIPSFDIKESE